MAYDMTVGVAIVLEMPKVLGHELVYEVGLKSVAALPV
jgi:hypothetical protein